MDYRERTIFINVQEYDSINKLSVPDRELIEEARKIKNNAYSPYSKFKVGAALRLSNDLIVLGSNQENVAFPSGICAERTALFYAHSQYPNASIKTIAISASSVDGPTDEPISPCGACRQVMLESQKRGGEKMRILLDGSKRIIAVNDVESLLPFSFSEI